MKKFIFTFILLLYTNLVFGQFADNFSEGFAFENTLFPSNYFDILCNYTSTRADKFWFDSFNISGDSANFSNQTIQENDMVINEIFDGEGRVVKNILNNEMIGNSGNTTWDGISENGLQLNTGIYIVWMEVFSENGNAEQFKEVIVLSR